MLSSFGCSKGQQKPEPKPQDEQKELPSIAEEIEGDIIDIMSKIDLVPYYEKQIQEKNKKKDEQKKIELIIGQKMEGKSEEDKSQSSEDQKSEDKSSSEGKKSSTDIEKLIEFNPKPINVNDVLLTDILKAESNNKEKSKEAEIPDDIGFVWHEINTKVKGLHEKWNELEPLVIKSGITGDAISGFKDTLNKLTIASLENKYMDSLLYSNKLTFYYPDLISNFKNKVPSSVYHMKYYIRQIVINSQNQNYSNANENLSKINMYKESLVSKLIDQKKTDLVNILNASISDLEDAIKIKDINIIKIKASIVMKNISSIKEELSKAKS